MVTDLERIQAQSDQVSRLVSLSEIRLSKVAAELHNATPKLPQEITASFTDQQFERPVRLVAIYHLSYQFSSVDSEKKPIWNVAFTLSVSCSLPKDPPISDEALQAFGALGVVDIAHPYARELVHHLTARMNVPAFVLEVLPPSWMRSGSRSAR